MKTFLSLLAVCCGRAIFSIRFLASVVGVTVVLFLTTFGMIESHSSVLSVLVASGSGSVILVVGIIPLLPFATTFASEWEERATSFWLIRSGVRAYSISKAIASAVSAACTTLAGILLYALLLLIKLPFFTTISTGDAYVSLLERNQPVTYLLFSAAHLSLSSSLFAVAALWISTYIPNRFTALAAPAVLYYVMFRLTRFWDLPPFLNLGMIVEGTYIAGSPLESLFLKFMTILTLCIIMGYGIVGQVRRRVQHD
ncbi:hypothetical protein [Paenibacillus sp. YYML68]|uniref:hypothetical protein n=1 Tax=Paenibacillus sp. YYML68 TaxID=2909250 RepID=UPI00249026FA|nr:hypothetical protein [Paenibacillus sp. YYML68]